jgi:hypothetical protein
MNCHLRLAAFLVTTVFFPVTDASTLNLAKTGLSVTFMAGDDGSTGAGLAWPTPRFTTNTDTTLSDALTGLVWVADAGTPTAGSCSGGGKTWQDALAYVACLNTGNYLGQNDWRLPNVNELESIVALGRSMQGWLNSQGFVNTPSTSKTYWTSTTRETYPSFAFNVNLYYGYVGSSSKTTTAGVLAVRSTTANSSSNAAVRQTGLTTSSASGDDGALRKGITWPAGRFSGTAQGAISDALTGLEWAKDANAPGPSVCRAGVWKSWADALSHMTCLNANKYLGYSDWRLPNRRELHSLIDFGRTNSPVVPSNHPFTNVKSDYYWTSSTNAFNAVMNPTFAVPWVVSMSDGSIGQPADSFSTYYVWPVRSGLVSTSTTAADCLFNWAEQSFPQYFSPGATSASLATYYYRHYPSKATYIATNSSDNHVWVLGPEFGPNPVDVGVVNNLLSAAHCQ